MIKMDALKREYTTLGFQNVISILASGNVIFDSDTAEPNLLAENITKKLRSHFKREVMIQVLPMKVIRNLIELSPFKDVPLTKDSRLYVSFIANSAQKTKLAKNGSNLGWRSFRTSAGIVCTEIYDITTADTLEVMASIEKQFAKMVTTRNWNTILKIVKAAKIA